MEEFFRENATNATAWSAGRGWHISFSVSRDIFSRDEDLCKKLAKKYGLKTRRIQSFVTFYKD